MNSSQRAEARAIGLRSPDCVVERPCPEMHRIEQSRHVLYEDPAPIRALEDFLAHAARAHS